MTHTVYKPPRPAPSWSRLVDPALPRSLQVWSVDLDSAPADERLLSPDERVRAGSFRFDIHRQRFVAGRAALRTKLGELLGVHPEELRIPSTAHGKPFLRDHALQFNLAHSENAALLGVAPFSVGIDLEHERAVEYELIAREVFSAEELIVWNGLPPMEKARQFFRLWTRKEALLKGVGCGITEHTQHVSVFFGNDAQISASALTETRWEVRSFEIATGFSAAVAWTSVTSAD